MIRSKLLLDSSLIVTTKKKKITKMDRDIHWGRTTTPQWVTCDNYF